MPDPVYAYPFAPTISPGRIDQGQDFSGAGDIRTVGPARFVRVSPQGSGTGWPGASGSGTGAMIVYQLTGGPQAGKYVYTAENVDPAQGVRVGSEVPAGTIFAHARGGYPFIETGWSDASGTPTDHASYTEGMQTEAGKDFANFLASISGNRYPFHSAVPPLPGSSTPPAPGSPAFGSGGGGLPHLPDLGGVGGALGGIPDFIKRATDPANVPGFKQAGEVADLSPGKFLGKLASAAFWIRALEITGGGLLILLGLAIIGRSLTTQASVVTVAQGASTLRNATPGRRSSERTRRSSPRTRASTVRDYGTTRAPSASHLRDAERERRLRADEESDIPF